MCLCINCGIAMDRCNTIGKRLLDDEIILSIVREWVAPRTVDENDFLCHSCWNHASSASLDGKRLEEMPVGHRRVCIYCGRSLLRRIRCHPLRTDTVQERRVYEVIKEWILPRTVSISSAVCHSCWLRANKASRHFHLGPSTSVASSSSVKGPNCQDIHHLQAIPTRQQPNNINLTGATIVLPDYFRPVETESRCFVQGCRRHERNRMTLSMRKQLFKMYNYYVPPNNRVCDFHLRWTSWDFLNNTNIKEEKGSIINTFNANHIQDMLSLKDSEF